MTDGTIPSLASGLLLSASLTLSLLSARPHCCYSLRAQESPEWSGSRTIFSICLDKMSCCLSKSSETRGTSTSCSAAERYHICRLVDGIRLLDYFERSAIDKHVHLTEARMVATAAPLLEVSADCMCCLLLACLLARQRLVALQSELSKCRHCANFTVLLVLRTWT